MTQPRNKQTGQKDYLYCDGIVEEELVYVVWQVHIASNSAALRHI